MACTCRVRWHRSATRGLEEGNHGRRIRTLPTVITMWVLLCSSARTISPVGKEHCIDKVLGRVNESVTHVTRVLVATSFVRKGNGFAFVWLTMDACRRLEYWSRPFSLSRLRSFRCGGGYARRRAEYLHVPMLLAKPIHAGRHHRLECHQGRTAPLAQRQRNGMVCCPPSAPSTLAPAVMT
jgi:hypothetical protein